MKYILVVLFALVVAAMAQSPTPVSFSSSNLKVTANPGEGVINLFDLKNNDKTYQFKFTQIQEVPLAGGVVNAVNSFVNAGFTTSLTNSSSINGVSAGEVSISTGNLNVSGVNNNITNLASLDVDVFVVTEQNTTSIVLPNAGGQSFDVDSNSAVFRIVLSNWPVDSSSNKLNIRARFTTPGNGGSRASANSFDFNDGASVHYPLVTDAGNSLTVSATVSGANIDLTATSNATVSTTLYYVFSLNGGGSSSASSLSSILSFLF